MGSDEEVTGGFRSVTGSGWKQATAAAGIKMLFFVFSPALSPRSTLPGPEHDGTAAWTCLAVITCFGARTVTISLLQFAHSLTPPAGHFRFSCFQHPPASPSHSLLKKKYISEFHSFTLPSTFGLKKNKQMNSSRFRLDLPFVRVASYSVPTLCFFSVWRRSA